MKAKPSKCKSVSFCNSTSHGSSTYGAVIAHLFIGPNPIADIADSYFKFLGRLTAKDLKDTFYRDSVLKKFTDYFSILDAELLKGAAKAWIYNNYIFAFISWPLLVYDFPPSFADKLTPVVNRYLKKWLKLFHPVSPEILYLPEVGLKLKHPKTSLKSLQLTKHHLLD